MDRALKRSEVLNGIFCNSAGDSRAISFLKKLRTRPYRYTSYIFYKLFWINAALTTKTFFGSRFTVPMWDENAPLIYLSGSLGYSESGVTRFLARALSPTDVFYDVGSNFGFYASLAGRLGAAVHAFEPNPATVGYVRRNAPGAIVSQLAIGDSIGSIILYQGRHKSGISSVVKGVADDVEAIEVKMTTLDEYVKNHPAPTVMKVDIETAEPLVIAGAKNMLAMHHPVLVIEVSDHPLSQEQAPALFSALKKLGYAAYEIANDGSLSVLSEVAYGNICFKKQIGF